jgi:hypothetical protein
MIKSIAIALAVLAAAKIGTVEYLQAAAAREAIMKAFRSDAVQACHKAHTQQDAGSPGAVWSRQADATVIFANRTHAVGLWQVDHPQWVARWRQAHVVLNAQIASVRLRCDYDTSSGSATVQVH